MKRALIGAVLVVATVVGVLTLFGDRLRLLLGTSSDALEGSPTVPRVARERKQLSTFGFGNAGDDGTAGASSAPAAWTPPVAITPAPVASLSSGRGPRIPNRDTLTAEDRFSTFGIDVDTASYSQARRALLTEGTLPQAESVRVEEWVNAFRYDLPEPEQGPIAISIDGAPSPFTPGRHLVRVALQGRQVSRSERKRAHLVFLVDVSGSMAAADRLPLAQQALHVLVDNLEPRDTVALVTYAGEVRDVLPPTPVREKARILEAIDALAARGGTSMGSGLELAYQHAVQTVSADSISRVIVLTDGDTNLGRNQSADQMLASIHASVEEGVTLTTVGFGMGNYRDELMQRLADEGNGNGFYVDGLDEARRIFSERLTGTLQVIAKDAKLQVEFNPAAVRSYRLLGYEKRAVADADFRNDRVDAGELGAGHAVTALYEVTLTGEPGALATVRVRTQPPEGGPATEQARVFSTAALAHSLSDASVDLRFAAAVAGAADVLRGNVHPGFNLDLALELAQTSTAGREERRELVRMIQAARRLRATDRTVAAGY